MDNNENRFDKIDVKFEKLDERLLSIDKTLERNTVSLEEHMRRTSILEEQIKPISKHVAMVQGVLQAAGGLLVLLSILNLLGLL